MTNFYKQKKLKKKKNEIFSFKFKKKFLFNSISLFKVEYS